MKKILVLLALTCWASFASAQRQLEEAELFCGERVSYDTKKAQWGLQLRDDMLRQCKGQNLKVCGKPWVDLIDKKEQADIAYILDRTAQQSTRPGVKTEVILATKQHYLAALKALTTGESAQKISNDLYQMCFSSKTSGGGTAPSQPTAAPAETSACTNYSILGQNGNTQYCQKCCWGTNNCNVTCY